MQASLDIISHYTAKYQLKFNADKTKTKIVFTGSKADMTYFKETKPWTLNGERFSVVDNNKHLGLIVSGTDEEQKNIDQNISKCRGSVSCVYIQVSPVSTCSTSFRTLSSANEVLPNKFLLSLPQQSNERNPETQ